MTIAFEFFPREERRIRFPRLSVIFFLAASLFGIGIYVSLGQYSRYLEEGNATAAQRLVQDTEGFMVKAAGLMPAEEAIAELEAVTRRHNLTIGGPSSVWTRLFNTLEQVMPDQAVITALEEVKTGKPAFLAEDRSFRIKVVVANQEAANTLYRKLTDRKSLRSLNFAPKGDLKYQGRTGINVELEFDYHPDDE